VRVPRLAFPALVACLVGASRELQAQSEAGRLIALARVQMDELNPDSAYRLLERALAAGAGATESQRVRAFTLLGITELLRDSNNRLAAEQAFEQALRIDGSLLIDTLAVLHSDALAVFTAVRARVAPVVEAPVRQMLEVSLTLPADTTVPVQGGRLRIETRPSYRSRVMVSLAPADAPTAVLWTDSGVTSGVRTAGWNLRGRDGALVRDGRYAITVRAVDSLSQVSNIIERVVSVARVPADTAPVPPLLGPEAFAPETLQLRTAPAALALGLGLGAAAAFLPTALGSRQLNTGLDGDVTAYAVAGTVSIAGVIGFLKGQRTRVSQENIRRNRELRDMNRRRREEVTLSNQRARDNAPMRIRVEGP
jgi:hypothetical protein